MRFSVVTFLLALVFTRTAVPADEVNSAKSRLNRQLQLIGQLEPFVERPYLARLYVLRSSSNNVLESINKNGLAHKTTFQEYQKLIVSYRYSVAFFKQIETEDTKAWCVELLKINQEIVDAHGFDDSPYTQITLSVYTQMEKLINQLSLLSLPDDLKVKIANVKPVLGEVLAIAKAKGGDRRTVYPVAERAFEAIEDLYADFNKISASDSAFEVTLEIQGLNEFYAEFAEFGAGE